jgi:hypothetical protein
MSRIKKFLLLSVLIGLLVSATHGTVVFLTDLRVEKKLNQEHEKAQGEIGAVHFSEESSKAWLESNGFSIVYWSKEDPNGWVGRGTRESESGIDHFIIIEGTKPIHEELLHVSYSGSMSLEFRLYNDGRQEIKVSLVPRTWGT